jgi:hypothetical protein
MSIAPNSVRDPKSPAPDPEPDPLHSGTMKPPLGCASGPFWVRCWWRNVIWISRIASARSVRDCRSQNITNPCPQTLH